MKLKKIFRLIFSLIIVGAICIISFLLIANALVEDQSKNTFNSIDDIPKNKVGLLLGTTKYVADGRMNLFYINRITAAVDLYSAEKIDFILASGDNGSEGYDEPNTMKADLIAAGVKEEHIYLDYAGFRTLDSVVRSKEVFGQDQITIISQQFHNERALYLAEKNDIEAVGFNAKDVPLNQSLRIKIRERFARVKMMVDLLLGVDPKFLGEKIEIK